MNTFAPKCLGDFLFSNADDRALLELILQRKLPFPFAGKNCILFHGTWGTGKTSLATLFPELLERAYSGTWDMSQGVLAMTPEEPSQTDVVVFRCGGGLSSTAIASEVEKRCARISICHHSQLDFFVIDEVERLTQAAQQSLRSITGLPRTLFLLTTNYLSKVDPGLANRCHLVEMNQVRDLAAYVNLGQRMLSRMGVTQNAISAEDLQDMARKARGSIRSFATDVSLAGLKLGGCVPTSAVI